MGSIFVSHRTQDLDAARQIRRQLRWRLWPTTVFLAADSLRAGENWRAELRKRLDGANAVVAVIGHDWIKADSGTSNEGPGAVDWVRWEIARALTLQKPVVPVLINGVPWPEEGELPDDLVTLASRQFMTVDGPTWRRDVRRLRRALAGPPPRVGRGRWWIERATFVVMLITGLWAAIWFWTAPPPVVTATTDPCAFLSNDDLAEFGRATLVPDYGVVRSCLATVQGEGDKPVKVRVELDVPLPAHKPFPGPVDTENDIVVARELCDSVCRTTLQRAGGPRVVVVVDHGRDRLGQLVSEKATETAKRVLKKGPLPDRPPFPERSVARIPACELLLATDLTTHVRDLKDPTPIPGFAGLTCAWGSPEPPTDTVIGIAYERYWPDEIPAPDERIGGRVVLDPKTETDGRQACKASVIGHTIPARTGEPRVEVVGVLVHGAGTRTIEQMCTYARALAEVAIPRLPR